MGETPGAVVERPKTAERKGRLQALGLERLSRQEMQDVAVSFGKHLRAGLEGKPSSLAAIPTYLQPIDLAGINPSKKALVVELGGTNIYGGLVSVDNGMVSVSQHMTTPISPDKNRKYTSAGEFFEEVAEDVSSLLHQVPDVVGGIWSFPAKIQPGQYGIDAISSANLTKEFDMPAIHTAPVGDQLIDKLHRKQPSIPLTMPRIITNDTVAVVLANGVGFGGVVGTGFNLAFSHNGDIYNLEAGGFSEVPQTALTRKVNEQSDKPALFLAEKQISGRYIEELFTVAARQEGILALDKKLLSRDMSSVLSHQLTTLQEKIPDIFSEKGIVLQEIAKILRDRSAQLLAAMVVGAIQAYPEDFPHSTVSIPIEGSFFGKTPGYKEAANTYAAQLLDEMKSSKQVIFTPVSQSGIKGAGVAALAIAGK